MNIEGLEGIVLNSERLTYWSVGIITGSFLILTSSEYIRPITRRLRLSYILFIPGWIYLGLSLKCGTEITDQMVFAKFNKQNEAFLIEVFTQMNRGFLEQRHYFYIGLAFFGAWLSCYVIWFASKKSFHS